MLFFSFSRRTSYVYLVICVVAAFAITGLSLILLFKLQTRTETFDVKRNVTTSDIKTPPIIYAAPDNPFDINFNEDHFRHLDFSRIESNDEVSPEHGGEPLPIPLKEKRLRKRDLIPVSWERMKAFMRHDQPSPTRNIILNGIPAMFDFFSELEEYKMQVDIITAMSNFLRRWGDSETMINHHRTDAYSRALGKYMKAVSQYPNFMDVMERIVGVLAQVAGNGQELEPEVMMKYLFVEAEETAQELDDEWLEFLADFLESAAEKSRIWIYRVQSAMSVYGPTILRFKSHLVSEDDFNQMEADLMEISDWFGDLANSADEASVGLRELRRAIDNHDWLGPELAFETPATLPFTPGLQSAQSEWYDATPELEYNNDLLHQLNEPLTPPSDFPDDDFMKYLRTGHFESFNQDQISTAANNPSSNDRMAIEESTTDNRPLPPSSPGD